MTDNTCRAITSVRKTTYGNKNIHSIKNIKKDTVFSVYIPTNLDPFQGVRTFSDVCKRATLMNRERCNTQHSGERLNRIHAKPTTKIEKYFIVDKGHLGGEEYHFITVEAQDYVFSKKTKKFITVLNCRPNQIRRLYEPLNLPIPRYLLAKATENKKLRRNRW